MATSAEDTSHKKRKGAVSDDYLRLTTAADDDIAVAKKAKTSGSPQSSAPPTKPEPTFQSYINPNVSLGVTSQQITSTQDWKMPPKKPKSGNYACLMMPLF